MSAIRLDRVVKSWGSARAVDGISLEADEGSLLVLLGPSGCGKSTTLRLIAGLEQPDSGTVTIGGVDVTHLTPAQRKIAMVFQSYALFPHLSVAENIVFGLRVRRVSRAERDSRLKRVADIVGLGQLLDRKPAQLSGGQRQRVALGRAIIAEARLCLMDEPLSNLDAKLRHEMRTEIRPEHIRIVSQDGRPARVKSVEHLGADSIVLCEIEGQPISVRQDGFSKAEPGDKIRLSWAAGDEHRFDAPFFCCGRPSRASRRNWSMRRGSKAPVRCRCCGGSTFRSPGRPILPSAWFRSAITGTISFGR